MAVCCGSTLSPPSPTKEYIINPDYSIPGIVIYFNVKLESTSHERWALNTTSITDHYRKTLLYSAAFTFGQSYCVNFWHNLLSIIICSRYIYQKYLERGSCLVDINFPATLTLRTAFFSFFLLVESFPLPKNV